MLSNINIIGWIKSNPINQNTLNQYYQMEFNRMDKVHEIDQIKWIKSHRPSIVIDLMNRWQCKIAFNWSFQSSSGTVLERINKGYATKVAYRSIKL